MTAKMLHFWCPFIRYGTKSKSVTRVLYRWKY